MGEHCRAFPWNRGGVRGIFGQFHEVEELAEMGYRRAGYISGLID